MVTAASSVPALSNSWVEFFHPQCQVQDMNQVSEFFSANGRKFQWNDTASKMKVY